MTSHERGVFTWSTDTDYRNPHLGEVELRRLVTIYATSRSTSLALETRAFSATSWRGSTDRASRAGSNLGGLAKPAE